MDPSLWAEIRAVEDRHWWFTGRRQILRHQVERLLPAGGSVLDVGCGTGFMLEALLPTYDAWGVEPDAAVRAEARPAVRERIVDGSAEDLSRLGGRRFDLVMLLDVLEHVADDTGTLRAVLPSLAPGGRVLITVPADPTLWSPHDERNAHFRRYDAAGLRAVIERAGLTPTLLTHFNHRLLPLARRHRRNRRANMSAELRLPPAPLNALLRRIFAGERRALPAGYPTGLSLIAVSAPTSRDT